MEAERATTHARPEITLDQARDRLLTTGVLEGVTVRIPPGRVLDFAGRDALAIRGCVFISDRPEVAR